MVTDPATGPFLQTIQYEGIVRISGMKVTKHFFNFRKSHSLVFTIFTSLAFIKQAWHALAYLPTLNNNLDAHVVTRTQALVS